MKNQYYKCVYCINPILKLFLLGKIIKNTVKSFINHLLILKHPKIIQKHKNKLDLKKLNLMELFINLLFILQDESQKPS